MREFKESKPTFFNRRAITLFSLIFIAIFFQHCIDDDETDFERQVRLDNARINEYLESNNIEAQQDPDGYFFIETKENSSGQSVQDKDVVSIYYHMTLLNGDKVDSATATKDGPVKFGFDSNRITLAPTGLYLGISTMKQGEAYRFYIPSYLAYGTYAYKQLIPANSIFIIDVELISIQNQDDQEEIEKDLIIAFLEEQQLEDVESLSSGLFYKQLSPGEGAKAKQGDNLKIHYTGKYLDGTVFDKSRAGSPLQLTLGASAVIEGFEEGIKLMQEGEKALFIIPSHLAFGASFGIVPAQIKEDLIDKDLVSDSIDPFTPVQFEVELVDVN